MHTIINKKLSITLLCAGIILLLTLLFSKNVLAVDYDVNAKVSAVVATQPAEVTNPTPGEVYTSEQAVISGSCQVTTPSQVVIIWRNGVFAGSGVCPPSGIFSIIVTLTPGQNILISKTSNITNDFGPDGQAVTVSYQPPTPPPTPTPTPDPTPAENVPSSPATPATNQPDTTGGSDKSLSAHPRLTSETDFILFNPNGEAIVTVYIEEGDAPYALTIDWGDGTVDTYNFAESGKKSLKHTYTNADNRSIYITVTDESGRVVRLVLGAVGTTEKLASEKGTYSPASTKPTARQFVVAGTAAVLAGAATVAVIAHFTATSAAASTATSSSASAAQGAKAGPKKGAKRGKK